MINNFLNKLNSWASKQSLIDAVILVGSHAKGTPRHNSDIDLILITSNRDFYIKNPAAFDFFGEINKAKEEKHGDLISMRTYYKSGLEVEYGLATPNWIELPLDEGTERVLKDGYKILLDKKSVFLVVKSIIPEYRK